MSLQLVLLIAILLYFIIILRTSCTFQTPECVVHTALHNTESHSNEANEITSTARAPRLARAPHLDFTARERKIVWQSATKFVRCKKLSVLRSHLAGFCVELVSARRYTVRIDCKMWNMCTRFASYDLQTADHLHNTTTKGRDGGALWRYFTVLLLGVSCEISHFASNGT